jgi:hypothetical protein
VMMVVLLGLEHWGRRDCHCQRERQQWPLPGSRDSHTCLGLPGDMVANPEIVRGVPDKSNGGAYISLVIPPHPLSVASACTLRNAGLANSTRSASRVSASIQRRKWRSSVR